MILNFFKKKQPNELSTSREIIENKLIFSFDDNGDVRAEIEICDLTPDDALKYADLIHSLSIGLYTQSIIDILTTISKENPSTEEFVKNTLISYSILNTFHQSEKLQNNKKYDSNVPIMKPTDFYKKYQHST